jgi:hypothetical protein
MKEFIKRKLNESLKKEILKESLRTPKPVELIGDEESYRNINYNDIELIDLDNDGIDLIFIGIKLPNEKQVNEGIVLDVKLVNDLYLIINILMDFNLQGKGLGYKIYEKFIYEFGHAFSSYEKRANQEQIPSIWNKLKQNSSFEVYDSKVGQLCVLKTNEDKSEIIQKFKELR